MEGRYTHHEREKYKSIRRETKGREGEREEKGGRDGDEEELIFFLCTSGLSAVGSMCNLADLPNFKVPTGLKLEFKTPRNSFNLQVAPPQEPLLPPAPPPASLNGTVPRRRSSLVLLLNSGQLNWLTQFLLKIG
ncbi:hypothetical protein E2C01_016681 [Portunus trituberculatus]|uniref:Uncharacterized protein n=1 Tax=Portunus trituberculatus TaxID=210409 RepID=A0A5B7DPP8_PORTR|nr:hypothetical protein [Portunus trituberculatus]